MSMSNSIQRKSLSRSNLRQSLIDKPLGPTYTFQELVVSPTGRWEGKYTTGDVADIRLDKDDATKFVFYQKATAATASNITHANKILSVQRFRNFILDVDTKTIAQRRLNDPPNPWEVAWILFRHSDDYHHYYFILKTNGIEFGKKDNETTTEEQIFLYTDSTPTLTLDTWYHIKIMAQGAHFMVWVDGVLVVNVIDNGVGPPVPFPPNRPATPKMYDGSIALYNEDAEVYFKNLIVNEI